MTYIVTEWVMMHHQYYYIYNMLVWNKIFFFPFQSTAQQSTWHALLSNHQIRPQISYGRIMERWNWILYPLPNAHTHIHTINMFSGFLIPAVGRKKSTLNYVFYLQFTLLMLLLCIAKIPCRHRSGNLIMNSIIFISINAVSTFRVDCAILAGITVGSLVSCAEMDPSGEKIFFWFRLKEGRIAFERVESREKLMRFLFQSWKDLGLTRRKKKKY